MFEHYIAVRKSNLYEYCGISKPLLAQIAGLIIGPPPEGEEPDPDEGWCVAGQDYLAAMIGCSSAEVSRQVNRFEADGCLTVKRFHDKYGHPRCHYTFTPEQMKAIAAREMQKDAKGDYIRAKKPKQSRKGNSNCQKNLVWNKKPLDGSSKGLLTDGQEATCESVKEPFDGLSTSVVPPFVPPVDSSSGRSSEKLSEKTEETSFPSSKERKEKQQQPQETPTVAIAPVGAEAAAKWVPPPPPAQTKRVYEKKDLMSKAVKEQFRKAGCPEEVITELSKWDFAAGLDKNPITAYVTAVARPGVLHNKFYDLWMPKSKGGKALTEIKVDGDDFALYDIDLPKPKPQQSPELIAAINWWIRLSKERQESLLPLSERKSEKHKGLPSHEQYLELHKRHGSPAALGATA